MTNIQHNIRVEENLIEIVNSTNLETLAEVVVENTIEQNAERSNNNVIPSTSLQSTGLINETTAINESVISSSTNSEESTLRRSNRQQKKRQRDEEEENQGPRFIRRKQKDFNIIDTDVYSTSKLRRRNGFDEFQTRHYLVDQHTGENLRKQNEKYFSKKRREHNNKQPTVRNKQRAAEAGYELDEDWKTQLTIRGFGGARVINDRLVAEATQFNGKDQKVELQWEVRK